MAATVSDPVEIAETAPSSEQIRIARIAAILPKVKPVLRDDLEPIRQRAELAIKGKSRSYVEDARIFAHIVLAALELRVDHAQAIEQLTVVQERCTEILEEVRILRATAIFTEDLKTVQGDADFKIDPFI